MSAAGRVSETASRAGFDNWAVFPPPGKGYALADALEAGCPGCGGEVRAVAPFQTLAERVLVGFLTPSDRAELEGIVELHCRECGYVGSAQK
jgi:hypothetical protein